MEQLKCAGLSYRNLRLRYAWIYDMEQNTCSSSLEVWVIMMVKRHKLGLKQQNIGL